MTIKPRPLVAVRGINVLKMAYSIKQLLFSVAVVAFGLVAMRSEFKPVLGKLFDLLTLGILIAMAYGAWLSNGESRAFRVGFLGWGLLYFFLFKKTFDIGIYDLINSAYRALPPFNELPPEWPPPFPQPNRGLYGNFGPVCHSLFLLLVGVIGGWVTVYLYRKRQRLIQAEPG